MVEETIAAISTPSVGSGGIGIVRISGVGAISAIARLYRGAKDPSQWESHSMHYGHIYDDGALIDECLAVIMRAPRSYTCEDVVEIHCHGGIRAVNAVLSAVLKEGVRLARPGEFTQRAFLAGRIDISQAEAVADIISSRSDAALAVAQSQLAGVLSARIRAISGPLVESLAHIEVSLDYPEHDDEAENLARVADVCAGLVPRLGSLIDSFRGGRVLREGVPVLILGRPNVGKSSLLNSLLGMERAIVTDIAGTTRDTLTESLSIGGVPIVLTDTAGIRDTNDAIERIGVERSLMQLDTAGLVLLVLDAGTGLQEADIEIMARLSAASGVGTRVIVILNKCDLGVNIRPEDIELPEPPLDILPMTTVADHDMFEEGQARLAGVIAKAFGLGDIAPDEAVIVTNQRHAEALVRARACLEEALEAACVTSEDVVAICIREALEALGEITGETVGEDLLDRIFSTFCLGK